MRGDLHIHSNRSPDSHSLPSEIERISKEKGLGFIAISDHNKFNVYKGSIIMIPAEEVSSKDGHILALFIDGWIPGGLSQEETVDQIHDKNGMAISAHPFRLVNGIKSKFKDIYDAIEVKNGRCGLNCNSKAEDLSKRLNISGTAGSDAHFYEEIGRVYLGLEEVDMEGIRKAITRGKVKTQGNDLSLEGQLGLYYKLAKDSIKRGFKRI